MSTTQASTGQQSAKSTPENSPLDLDEYRCKCGKLLFKAILINGIIELKCKRCQNVQTFTAL